MKRLMAVLLFGFFAVAPLVGFAEAGKSETPVKSEAPAQDPEPVLTWEQVFGETMARHPAIAEAQEKIRETELQNKLEKKPVIFFLIQPMDLLSMRRAAEQNAEAAEARYEATVQKELLTSARLYTDLIAHTAALPAAYYAKLLGEMRLKQDEHRFQSGEAVRFDVTRSELDLLEKANRLEQAITERDKAQFALAAQVGRDVSEELRVFPVQAFQALSFEPELVPVLELVPEVLPDVRRITLSERPELEELRALGDALAKLKGTIKGVEGEKLESELRQMNLEMERAEKLASVSVLQAEKDYQLAKGQLKLAEEAYQKAVEMFRQLEVSRKSGFSSDLDVMAGRVTRAEAQSKVLQARAKYNLAQIELLYEMGMLKPNVLDRPPEALNNLP